MRIGKLTCGAVVALVALVAAIPGTASGSDGTTVTAGDCDPFALDSPATASASSAARVSEAQAALGMAEPNVQAAYRRALRESSNAKRAPRVAGPIRVPVYVHVIQPTAGSGIVPPSQIQAQIDVLNAAYAGGPGGDNTAIVFELIDTDVTVNPAWHNLAPDTAAEVAMKTALREGGARSLNLYLVTLASLLGWATFPDEYTANPTMDGVVVEKASVPGGTLAPFNEGDTATHEVGHWLGLFHTFQGGCGPPGDLVDDTEPESMPHFGCPVVNSCPGGGNDPVDNFMSYSDDACMFRFTPGQTERMHAQTAEFRNSAPVGGTQAASTSGAAVPVTIAATDPDGDALTYTVVGKPRHGKVKGNGGALTYKPKKGFAGTDSFAVQAADTFGAAAAVTVNVDVTGVSLKAKKKQKLRKLAVTGTCGSAACTLAASGKIVATGSGNRQALASKSFKLKQAKGKAKADGSKKLKLKLSGSKKRQLLRLLADGWKAKAKVKVKASGPAGKSSSKTTITVTR